MPAAPLMERRASSRSRTKASADRARPRLQRPATLVPSKLRAARSLGVQPRTAAAAAVLLAALILAAALATGGRGAKLIGTADDAVHNVGALAVDARGLFQSRFVGLGLRVNAIRLQGASKAARDDILRAAAVRAGEPILGLDLDAIRRRVERVGWVGRARVIRLLPDTLVIAVTERPLAAVWQVGGRRYVVAAGGQPVIGVDPADFRKLPLIIGQGANTEAAALLTQIGTRPRLTTRLEAIRRVDGRRWDILLKDHGVILLPASDEAAALARLDRLDRVAGVLALGLARIDLRARDFTVIRPAAAAEPELVSHGV